MEVYMLLSLALDPGWRLRLGIRLRLGLVFGCGRVQS